MNSTNRYLLPAFLLFIFLSQKSVAQKPTDQTIDPETQQKIEQLAETAGEDADMNSLLDQLEYFKSHPLNLNNATPDEMEKIPLLNSLQIASLLKHLEENGKLLSTEELQTINGFDPETIRRILPYVTVSENDLIQVISPAKLLTDGKSTLLIRGQQTIEQQAGYINQTKERFDSNKCYIGGPLKLYTRYRYTYRNRISFGFAGEKDAGEAFLNDSIKGFDFYSYHLFYRGNGIIRTIALGDFHAQYGQGLVMYSGLAFGKSVDIMNIRKNARGLVPFTSTDENNYLRGGAVSLGIRKMQLDLFYSSHKRDANVLAVDTVYQEDEAVVSSLEETGYHRTRAEISDRHVTKETITGGHLQYKSKKLTLGVTGFTTTFDHPVAPGTELYKQFEFSGRYNQNYGFDYSYLLKNIHFFGEAARSENGGMAYLNGVLISLDSRFGVSLLQRHYDKNYQNLKSNGLSENSKNANEDGIFLGITTRPTRDFTFNAYFDQFSFPWLKYQVEAPSDGYESLAQLNYSPNKNFNAYVRFKQQSKPENIPGNDYVTSRLQEVVTTDYRFNIRYRISPSFILGNRVEYLVLDKSAGPTEYGYLIYQDVIYHPMKSRFALTIRYSLFDTDSYDSRIYSFENDVHSSYYIPSSYYRGSRYYFLVRYKVIKGIDLWLRWGRTMYENRKTAGNGLDLINAPHKTDVTGQVRFEF